jgi:Protein of unknown function (DUF3142)
MRRRLWLAGLALALVWGCRAERAGPVDARQYDAFFLWPGVSPPEALHQAKTIYLLAGELRGDDPTRIVPLRAVPQVRGAEVWLTLRAERLDWGEGVYRQIEADLARWQGAGNRLAGLQVDFDAATKGLDGYAAFLADLRRRLPKRYRLSVTGLMDWSAHGDPAALAGLAGSVDEVVIQTYQGRRTIPGYAAYMASLEKLPIPFRIGLVEHGTWQAPVALARNPNFRGYVVFLIRSPPISP